MKYVIIAIGILLILLAVYIFFRTVRHSVQGKCCEGCKSCEIKDSCSMNVKDKDKKIDY